MMSASGARVYLPATLDAVRTLGSQIAAARRELGWTAADLADRLGVDRKAVSRIEHGAPGTAIGTVFEAAVVVGVPLFGAGDPSSLASLAGCERDRVALLPQRVRSRTVVIPNDF